jgi:UDP-N-acetyl-D-glucosamine dehydrogenase
MSPKKNNLPPAAKSLIDRLSQGQSCVGVIGLGYVGLPLVVVLAEAGYQVIGIDNDARKVEAIGKGESYIEDVPSMQLRRLVENGSITASTSYEPLASADAVSICVPTPLRKTGDPDLSFIVAATEALRPILHSQMVIVLESTTYPGTTREMLLPALEAAGLHVGEDFFLAFSPERVDPGREDWTTKNTPKVIGGITPACTQVASVFYGRAIKDIVAVSSAEVAEMAKLLENTFRAVNIGLVNELALMCNRLGIDVWEVIEAAASKPFGFMRFTPGPGLGGHCIPIDPLYLSWKLKSVKYTARFIELASEINTSMPRYVVGRVQDAMNTRGMAIKDAKMLVAGVAYKPNVGDTRESPAIDVIGLLREKGAQVSYYDPYVPALEHDDWVLHSVPDLNAAARKADCVIIITDHACIDYQALAEAATFVFDSRNAMGAAGITDSKIVRL